MQNPAPTQFEDDCHHAGDELKIALLHVFDSVSANPFLPQDVSRRFKVNRNLTWKIARILKASDNFEAIRHVPGADGLEILARRMEEAGAEEAPVKQLRDAVSSFEKMVEIHVGDRATLDLVLDSMAPGTADRLETSRKLAFRGNSGVWGVQAKTRLTLVFMAPNKDDDSLLDSVQVMGYYGFRRFRQSVCCPLLIPHTWSAIDGAPVKVDHCREPLMEDGGEFGELNLMREFCTGTLPEITSTSSGMMRRHRLARGPIGNLGAFDMVVGDVLRGLVPRYADESNPTGEQSTAIVSPVENLVFDMIVHKDLDFAFKPTVATYGKEWQPGCSPEELEDIALPMTDRITRLSGRPPVVTTPLVPRYNEIVECAYERMGWNRSDFRGVRLHMKYPPLDSTVTLRFPLPDRPE